MDSRLLPIGEAAKYLGVTIQTLRRWDKNGKLVSFRPTLSSHRYYRKDDLELFVDDLRLLVRSWAMNESANIPKNDYYCASSDVFKARLIRLQNELAKIPDLGEIYSLIVSIAGEIGNNSFDHNLGVWPDIPGVFFGYDVKKRQIVLGDRGQGILETLKRIKSQLKNSKDALKVAFTEIISGRAPESRGNGLKFVRRVVVGNPVITLLFQSGDAELFLGENKTDIDVKKSERFCRGCIAIINF
jgi:hypothetical protein